MRIYGVQPSVKLLMALPRLLCVFRFSFQRHLMITRLMEMRLVRRQRIEWHPTKSDRNAPRLEKYYQRETQ